MLTLAFLRVDPNELFHHFTRPGLVALATLWAMLLVPTVLGIGFLAFGLDQSMPGLYFMLVLQMSAPGLMSSPALAALLGLDVALTLATLIVSTAITPLTASLFTHVFLGSALASPFGFGLRLFLIIAGCAPGGGDHPARGRTDLHRGSARTHRRVECDCDVHVRSRRHGWRGRSFPFKPAAGDQTAAMKVGPATRG